MCSVPVRTASLTRPADQGWSQRGSSLPSCARTGSVRVFGQHTGGFLRQHDLLLQSQQQTAPFPSSMYGGVDGELPAGWGG